MASVPHQASRFPSNTIRSVSTLFPSSTTATATTTSDATSIVSDMRRPSLKSPSIWSNDPDPFGGPLSQPAPNPNPPRRSSSLRASSPTTSTSFFHRHRTESSSAAIPTQGIAGGLASPASSSTKKHQRLSLLVTASDVLFSRRSSLIRPSTSSSKKQKRTIELEDDSPVLDISRAEIIVVDEEAEREALRTAAAKSVGLDGVPMMSSSFVERSSALLEEEDEDQQQFFDEGSELGAVDDGQSLVLGSRRGGPLSPSSIISAQYQHLQQQHQQDQSSSSSTSLADALPLPVPYSPPAPLLSLPRFPSSLSSLKPYQQLSSSTQRHYPSSFLLSRRWKTRHLVLTSLKPSPSADTQAHLHIFRGDDEIERMRIDEDSIVHVVEGSKLPNVIEVGGVHAGGDREKENLRPSAMSLMGLSAMSNPAMAGALGGRNGKDAKVLWLLQMQDAESVRRWIAGVKGALLVQRAERAGLTMTNQSAPVTGDVDVLLSLGAQGLLPNTISPTSKFAPSSEPIPLPNHKPTGRSRSNTSTSTSTVGALKGLFSSASVLANGSSRPRSSSSVTNHTEEESLGNRASILLRGGEGMVVASPIQESAAEEDLNVDLELVEPQLAERPLSSGSSLAPPPRKQWSRKHHHQPPLSPPSASSSISMSEQMKRAMFAPVSAAELSLPKKFELDAQEEDEALEFPIRKQSGPSPTSPSSTNASPTSSRRTARSRLGPPTAPPPSAPVPATPPEQQQRISNGTMGNKRVSTTSTGSTGSGGRSSRRLTPPAPPPTGALPPTPVNVRRSSSASVGGSGLGTIPGSPPKDEAFATQPQTQPPSLLIRTSSLRTRLRMLSTPAPGPSPSSALPPIPVAISSFPLPDSRPETPIDRPIISRRDSQLDEEVPGPQPLSPPPPIRRRSTRAESWLVPRDYVVGGVGGDRERWEPSRRESGILL